MDRKYSGWANSKVISNRGMLAHVPLTKQLAQEDFSWMPLTADATRIVTLDNKNHSDQSHVRSKGKK